MKNIFRSVHPQTIRGGSVKLRTKTDLKKKGLLTTFRDEGIEWVEFTVAGCEFAEGLGIVIQN